MAANPLSCDDADKDYINMEVNSHKYFFSHPTSSPPHPREFEFQMFTSFSERNTTTSPADELFYKGKLLPLHNPPRLEMVEKLLQISNSYDKRTTTFDEFFGTPLTTNTNTTPTSNTPFESCNISPSESCQVSKEINPNEYFSEYSSEVSSFIDTCPKKSWTRKLKLIKQSSLGSKLKSSRAYLKSLFIKPGPSRNMEEGSVPKTKECVNNYANVEHKTSFGQIKEEKVSEDGVVHHRRSFSAVIKRLSTIKSLSSSGFSSSSSLSNSYGFHELHFLKSTSSSNSDIESSIQSAIAHCKKSQVQFHSRKTLSDVGFCPFSATGIICEDHER